MLSLKFYLIERTLIELCQNIVGSVFWDTDNKSLLLLRKLCSWF